MSRYSAPVNWPGLFGYNSGMTDYPLTHLPESAFVIGHDWALTQLRQALLHGRTRHAYLFLGVDGVGKETVATVFAMLLNCQQAAMAARPCGVCSACRRIIAGQYPDLIYGQTDEATGVLKIEEVRRVIGQLALKPFEARQRIALLRDFHMARGQAQDALLKTLEEPPPGALLLLLAPSSAAVLPTITSRSQLVHLRPVPATAIRDGLVRLHHADPDQARLLANLSGGRVGWAVQALHDPAVLQARTDGLDLLGTRVVADSHDLVLPAGLLERVQHAFGGALVGAEDALEVWEPSHDGLGEVGRPHWVAAAVLDGHHLDVRVGFLDPVHEAVAAVDARPARGVVDDDRNLAGPADELGHLVGGQGRSGDVVRGRGGDRDRAVPVAAQALKN